MGSGRRMRGSRLAGFLDFDDFASLVGAALGADVMRLLALVAVGALGERAAGDGIVGATERGAPFGMAALWVRHGRILSVPLRCDLTLEQERAGSGEYQKKCKQRAGDVQPRGSLPVVSRLRSSERAVQRGSEGVSSQVHGSVFRLRPQRGQSP